MTLLIWMLLYPLVAAADLTIRVRVEDLDTGKHNIGHAAVYLLGTAIFLTLTIFRYV
jgi:hypothetical protein